MIREQGDMGDALSSSTLKSAGDAPMGVRVGTPMPPRKRHTVLPRHEDLDLRRMVVTWTTEQLGRVQPWKVFLDTAQLALPKSAPEASQRIKMNVERFRSNYGILFLGILSCYVVACPMLLMTVAATVGVCASLKIHLDENNAALWGTGMMLTKNQRLAVAASLALPLLYIMDFGSAVVWSFVASLALAAIHATLFSEQWIPIPSVPKTLADIPEEGDMEVNY